MIIAGPFCNDDCIAGIDVCRSQCESARELRNSAAQAVINTFHKELGMQWCDNSRKVVVYTRDVIEGVLNDVIEELILNGKVEWKVA
jgi:hypothetical protein